MPKVCFYFLLHQPYRLRDYGIFNLGEGPDEFNNYFDTTGDDLNGDVFRKVADKSYRPMLELLLKLVRKNPRFHFSMSFSGIFLEQASKYAPDVLEIIKKLASEKKQVEILAETYYHSLSALYSPEEFQYQVKQYLELVWKLFKVRPTAFRNTELIYNNYIGQQIANLGYDLAITEGVEQYLSGRSRGQLFRAKGVKPPLFLLLKNAQLSDDIAFRFSQKSWVSYPLTAKKYLSWLDEYDDNEVINLFMDFETFGEHQWPETGIFEFFEDLAERFLEAEKKTHQFVTPSEMKKIALEGLTKMELDVDALPIYDINRPISWADCERDLSAWMDNDLQYDTNRELYGMRETVLASGDKKLIEDWRKLTTSDHFYYMCTKYFNDGDVHAYFSGTGSPYEAYRRLSIVLADMKERVEKSYFN